jgi:N-acetylneuraminate synthase
MKIADRDIGPGNPVFVVAELSGSHLGSLKNAHRLIDYAAGAGADAIKLQSYHPSDFTTPDAPPLTDGPWKGERPWNLYGQSMTPREWHAELFDHAHNKGMVAFSTPFSPEAVEFLETLDCPAYKVASLELGYRPLLDAIADTGKPALLSTGTGWSDCEVIYAGPTQHVLMHCVSAYPTPIGRANIGRVRHFASFRIAGLSDHSKGFMVPVLAVALGACVIEKHIKLYEDTDGPDAGFAENPAAFKLMVDQVRLAEDALRARDNTDLEAPMRALRRREIDGRWLRVAP